MAFTPVNSTLLVAVGSLMGTMRHGVPFQCSVNGTCSCRGPLVPIAQTSELDTALTEVNAELKDNCGVGTTVQVLPFQCSARLLPSALPTPQTSFAEIAVLATSRESGLPGDGLGTTRNGELAVDGCGTGAASAAPGMTATASPS